MIGDGKEVKKNVCGADARISALGVFFPQLFPLVIRKPDSYNKDHCETFFVTSLKMHL